MLGKSGTQGKLEKFNDLRGAGSVSYRDTFARRLVNSQDTVDLRMLQLLEFKQKKVKTDLVNYLGVKERLHSRLVKSDSNSQQ